MHAHDELALALPVASPDQEPAHLLASFREARQGSNKADDQSVFTDAPQKWPPPRLVHDAALSTTNSACTVPHALLWESTLIRRAEE